MPEIEAMAERYVDISSFSHFHLSHFIARVLFAPQLSQPLFVHKNGLKPF